jgi:hypothetical protein
MLGRRLIGTAQISGAMGFSSLTGAQTSENVVVVRKTDPAGETRFGLKVCAPVACFARSGCVYCWLNVGVDEIVSFEEKWFRGVLG